jgi:dipeptidyl aminopeptidase/acylaminoacyl peptidase
VAFDHEDDDGIGPPGRVLPGAREMLFSDGYDLWALPLSGGVGRNLTRTGRAQKVVFTHLVLDDDAPFGGDGRNALVSSFDQKTKARALHRLDLESGRLERLLALDKEFGTPRKAQNADRWVMTIEDGHQSPELWVAGPDFAGLRRVTDANPWLKEYELPPGELVEWRSADGEALQGILIKPVGYESGKRYPTIVHLYEKMSQQLHRFRGPGLGLNPQVWAQRGYAVLLPDVVYQIGRPGPSAVKCIVPAVQKLVDLGITDAARVGICGHSWGGYETAYIITQTRIFAAAIAGAPVVNMTSAYNGIRWSTGIPRQFQYEQSQSRIGGTLWDYPELFIENSPIFHLRSVTTPVLIEFGNNDGAVPWYQGIEFYLGMRRLGKPAVLLEYKDEGHGLRRRPNREDYTKRTLEWWDHFLKGAPAADWIGGPSLPKSLEGAAPVANPTSEDARK